MVVWPLRFVSLKQMMTASGNLYSIRIGLQSDCTLYCRGSDHVGSSAAGKREGERWRLLALPFRRPQKENPHRIHNLREPKWWVVIALYPDHNTLRATRCSKCYKFATPTNEAAGSWKFAKFANSMGSAMNTGLCSLKSACWLVKLMSSLLQ